MPTFELELTYRVTQRAEIVADTEDGALAEARRDYHLYHVEDSDDFSTLDDVYVIAELKD